jgi:hypothetical protein
VGHKGCSLWRWSDLPTYSKFNPPPYGVLVAQGAVYVFVQNQDTMMWSQKQKIVPTRPLENDRFGAAVVMSDDFLAIGVPNRQKSFALTSTVRCSPPSPPSPLVPTSVPGGFRVSFSLLGSCMHAVRCFLPSPSAPPIPQGAIDIYVRNYTDRVYFLAYDWVYSQTLTSSAAQTTDRLGSSLSLNGNFLISGTPNRFSPTQSDIVSGTCPLRFMFPWVRPQPM